VSSFDTSKTYTYTVASFDAADNTSAVSNESSAKPPVAVNPNPVYVGGVICTDPSCSHAPPPTSNLVVNVRDTGARCDGVTDDTAAIQRAIDQVGGTGGTVLVPAGTCLITHQTTWPSASLILKSNMTFKMEPGAVIKMKPSSSGMYTLLYMANVSNVNIVGGKLLGERHQHLTPGNNAYTTPKSEGCPIPEDCWGQWGYGIWVDYGSRNIYVDGVESREMWGDGLAVSGAGGGKAFNVNVYNFTADDNRRQGMSIMDVDGMVVRNSVFKNTWGHSPISGIDIEPMAHDTGTNNILIEGNTFDHNRGAGLLLSGVIGKSNNITVKNNIFTYNSAVGMVWYNPGVGSSFSGNTFSGNGYNDQIGYTI
jgi:parallel beta-helix repeat protein